MIINNRHENYLNARPEIIRDVVLNGSHTLDENETPYFTIEDFSPFYEAFLGTMNLDILALDITEEDGIKIIRIHPLCMGRLGTEGLLEYRAVFEERFEDGVNGRKAGEAVLVSPSAPIKGLVRDDHAHFPERRQKNDDYATLMVYILLDDPLPTLADDYGWIENRNALFREKMDQVFDCYVLPRLPLGSDDEGNPYFKADADDVSAVQDLYHARKKEMQETENAMRNTCRNDIQFSLSMGYAASLLRTKWLNENKEKKLKDYLLNYSAHFIGKDSDRAIDMQGGHNLTTAEGFTVSDPKATIDFPVPVFN